MSTQKWYCVHAKEDQTQIQEQDSGLRDFLNQHQVSNSYGLLERAARGFFSAKAKRGLLFYNFRYNQFSHLPDTQDYRLAIYGMRGDHVFRGRATGYMNIYYSDDEDMMGIDFFRNVFGSVYLSEKELKVNSVQKTLQRRITEHESTRQSMDFKILEKDRELVCKIVERLWTSQVETSGSGRLLICLPATGDILERSVELLQQVYLLIPQKLRLNMGLATCCENDDIKTLTEECDLPIHIFTIATDDIQKVQQEIDAADFRYPVVLFDASHPERETCDSEKMELLLELSRKVSDVTDAKMAYAEKNAMKKNRTSLASFKNMDLMLRQLNNPNFCWWERDDLNCIEDVYQICSDQSELMSIEVLKQDALNSFYQKLLPWKDYALQIAKAVIDEKYPKRQELLTFFSDELKLAKIIAAMQTMKEEVEASGQAHEQQTVLMLRQRYQKELDSSANKIESLHAEKKQAVQEYEIKIQNQKASFARERDKLEKQSQERIDRATEQFQLELEDIKEAHQKELQTRTEQQQQKIQQLSKELDQIKNISTDKRIKMIRQELESSQDDNEKLKEDLKKERKKRETAAERVKKFKKTTGILSAVSGVLLVLAIVFLVLMIRNGLRKSDYKRQLDQLQELQNQKEQQMQIDQTPEQEETIDETLQNDMQSSEGVSENEISMNAEGKKALVIYSQSEWEELRMAIDQIRAENRVQEKMIDEQSIEVSDSMILDDYDTVYIGYSAADGIVTENMRNYISAHNDQFYGKTVIPFRMTASSDDTAELFGQLMGAEVLKEKYYPENMESED